MDLTIIWAAIIAFGVIVYVILDGFDLGVGILFAWIHDDEHRSIMMDTVAPVWDGNETWLVLGGALLYGAFPAAYSTLLPTLYLPLMIMLAALIFRGVAFEFRHKAHTSRFIWDVSFAGGSFLASFMQGMVLGAIVEGSAFALPVPGTWFTPFTIMTGVAVAVGYTLLGSTWLISKTEGALQQKMFHVAKLTLLAMVLFYALVSLWTPFIEPRLQTLWFSLPNFFYLLPLPIIAAISIIWLWFSLKQKKEFLPFWLSISLFIYAYIGLCISTWPYIVPHQLTIWQAAAPETSQIFLLVGTLILVPILLIYTAYTYSVFRGKVVKGGTHYH